VKRVWSTALIVASFGSVVIAAGCSDTPDTASPTTPSPSVTDTSPAVNDVPLAPPDPRLMQQCQDAAATLGFAVPCPDRLPLVAGEPALCSDSCTAMAGGGETLDTIFFIDVEGFDSTAPADEVRHLIIEARRVDRSPPSPCFGGTPIGHIDTGQGDLNVVDCPVPTAADEASIRHGEGAHSGHVLGYWDEGGVRNVVSVHGGSTEPNRALLAEIASSVEIVER